MCLNIAQIGASCLHFKRSCVDNNSGTPDIITPDNEVPNIMNSILQLGQMY